MSASVIHFQFPHICARCGANQELLPWKIDTARTGLHWSSFLLIVFGFIVTSTERYTFYVPVCATCRKVLSRNQKILLALRIGLVAAVTAFLLLFLLARRIFDSSFLGLPVGLIIASLAVIIVVIMFAFKVNTLVSFDGTFFNFKNDEFQRQFMKLNPELVSPQGHEQEKYFR